MKENNKNRPLVLIICMLLVLIAAVGSYAYYVAQITGDDFNSAVVTTKKLGIIYNDGKDISLAGVLPGQTFIKTVTVENTGNKTMSYDLALIDVTNTLGRQQDLVYSIAGSGMATTVNVTNQQFPNANGNLISDMEIAPGETHTYTITIVYTNEAFDQGDDMDSTVTATLNIADVKEVTTP